MISLVALIALRMVSLSPHSLAELAGGRGKKPNLT